MCRFGRLFGGRLAAEKRGELFFRFFTRDFGVFPGGRLFLFRGRLVKDLRRVFRFGGFAYIFGRAPFRRTAPVNVERILEIPVEFFGSRCGSAFTGRFAGRLVSLFGAGGAAFLCRFFFRLAGLFFGEFGDPLFDLAGDFAERLFRLFDDRLGELFAFGAFDFAVFFLFGGNRLFDQTLFSLPAAAGFLFGRLFGADGQVELGVGTVERVEESLFEGRGGFLFFRRAFSGRRRFCAAFRRFHIGFFGGRFRIFFKRRDEIPPMFLTLFGHIDPKYCVTNFCGAAGETERPKIPLNLNPGEPEKSGSDRVRRKRELSGSAPENKARKTQGGAAKTLPPHYNNFPFK